MSLRGMVNEVEPNEAIPKRDCHASSGHSQWQRTRNSCNYPIISWFVDL